MKSSKFMLTSCMNFVTSNFHVLAGIFRLNPNQLFHKVLIPYPIGKIQKHPEVFKAVIGRAWHPIHSCAKGKEVQKS